MVRFLLFAIRDMPFVFKVALIFIAILAVLFFLNYGSPPQWGEAALGNGGRPASFSSAATPNFTSTPTPTSTPIPTASPTSYPTRVELPGTATGTAIVPSSTFPPGGIVYVLKPSINRVGWVVSSEEEGNHFGAHNIKSGFLDGYIYYGAMQFDISFIPPGSIVYAAELELTGLDGEHLSQEGTWSLRMLDESIDENWPSRSYAHVHSARVNHTLSPELHHTDLGRGIVNVFTFNASQRAALEERFAHGKVSFRLDGPSSGSNNLFSWDSGYGPGSMGKGPTLRLALGIPTPAPISGERQVAGSPTPMYVFVMVTSTPTPENVLTMAAIAVAETVRATTVGTNTPTPFNWATPFVVTSTPTPENEATATYIAAMTTAMALAIGTNTPTPSNMVTPTPTPTFVIVTSTPTPLNILTAAAIASTATTQAIIIGTATPTPLNWVTPLVVTSTPTPENKATAEMVAMLLTAQTIITGTATPTPPNQFTATPTPLLVEVKDASTPTPVPTPTSTPDPLQMPPELKGKIAFLSDREGEEATYVMDPDGSNIARLTNRWAYDLACALDTFSPDRSQRLFVRSDKQDTCIECEGRYDLQIWVQNLGDGWVWTLVNNAEQVYPSSRGNLYIPGWDFDPAWSPDSSHIAYVSTMDGNQEIHVVNKDDISRPDRRLTVDEASDGHPSWSPDGRQIVFWSDRGVERKQIWIMDADGNNQRSLSNNSSYNDWNPVWIKWP